MPKPALLTKCTNMIPATDVTVVIVRPDNDLTISPLTEHGLDELDCGWEGRLEFDTFATNPRTYHGEGDCPRCGRRIVVEGEN